MQRPKAGHGRLILEVSTSHTMTRHSGQDSPAREIGPSQKPPPDNTQHSQETNIHAPERFEPAIPASDRPQTLALDRSATGIGYIKSIINKILNVICILIYSSFCVPNFASLSHNIQIRSSLLYKMRLAQTCRQKSELLGLV